MFIILIIKLILQISRNVEKLAFSDVYYASDKDIELLENPKT